MKDASDTWHRYLPWTFFLGSLTLYLWSHQRWMFGDGIFFDEMLQKDEPWLYYQLLYLPLARSVHFVCGSAFDLSPELSLKILSAVAGALGVTLTYSIARRALDSTLGGAIVASTLMGLSGYWFHSTAAELHAIHATCSLMLFAGLLLVLDDSRPPSGATVWLFAGAFLTPLSHSSGMAMGLPILYVLWKADPDRRVRACLAIGMGVLVFGVLYALAMLESQTVRGSASMIASRYAKMIANPGTIMPLATGAAGELLLYSLPAATLVPAGLRILFRTAPTYAWLCLLWILAWPIAVFSVGDYAFGSYQMPTFPIQALLAAVALHGLARTPLRAIATIAVASVPILGLYLDAPRLGIALCLINGLALAFVDNDHIPRPRWTWLLPLVTFAVSGPYILPILQTDPYRPRIAAVDAAIPRGDLVLFVTDDVSEHHHWRRFFPGAMGRERAFNPIHIDSLPDDQADEADVMLRFLEVTIRQALDSGRGIWVVGEFDRFQDRPRVMQLYDFIRKECELVHPPGAPTAIYKLQRRE